MFQLKKKTAELNKACEKHYALEQELAFYKIDSKFDSLGLGPKPSHDEVKLCCQITIKSAYLNCNWCFSNF